MPRFIETLAVVPTPTGSSDDWEQDLGELGRYCRERKGRLSSGTVTAKEKSLCSVSFIGIQLDGRFKISASINVAERELILSALPIFAFPAEVNQLTIEYIFTLDQSALEFLCEAIRPFIAKKLNQLDRIVSNQEINKATWLAVEGLVQEVTRRVNTALKAPANSPELTPEALLEFQKPFILQ